MTRPVRLRVIRLFALCALGMPRLAPAQTIAGQVLDRARRAPVANAVVDLLGDTSVVATGQSGRDGVFALIAPAAGTYRVRLSVVGGEPHVSDTIHVAAGSYVAREFTLDLAAVRTYMPFEVDEEAEPTHEMLRYRYPEEFRRDGTNVCVRARFVVDERARIDTAAFRVEGTNDSSFVRAVRAALPRMRFAPARISGRPVRQRVVHPFHYGVRAVHTAEVVEFGRAPTVPGSRVNPTGPPPIDPSPLPAACAGAS